MIWSRRSLTREQLSNLFLELFEREGRFVLQQRGLLLRFTVLNPYQQAQWRSHDTVTKEVIQLVQSQVYDIILTLALRISVPTGFTDHHPPFCIYRPSPSCWEFPTNTGDREFLTAYPHGNSCR
ncbi:hypothetical protein F2Q70_00029283 [Brassica cretica]|uniref:Uncharacterized protein n=1 Tax=Brassica cretica TaxID=69181 RepID=A0A8S9FE44_BRACR|nr:hypothetical protein F2Q70_00029283 [Brassica cretica]